LQQYSIVISIYGWAAKHIATGKHLSGTFDILPWNIGTELSKLLIPSTDSLCVTSTVSIPEENEFNLWFQKQPIRYM
jgi:hypothetical protein